MVVRGRFLRPAVVVREDAEAELGILVQDMAFRRGVAHARLDEFAIAQGLLEERADFLPAGRARVGREEVVAVAREAFEVHLHLPIRHAGSGYYRADSARNL